MARYVCSGAKLTCSMGSRESDLAVLPVRPTIARIKGKFMGTIMDNKPIVNIKPFGQCQSLANPTVAVDNDEIKEKEKDNDPNLMPSRFMLLYGADDDELRSLGNMDDHPDKFDDQEEEHKISVEMLRLGLQILGYSVEDTGPFDDAVYHAFLQYHWQHGCVSFGSLYEDENDPRRPLDRVADRYGVSTWKYLHDKYGGEIDHERIMEELNTEYGDELLAEKGVDPDAYKPGVSYHYVWVPFSATGEVEGEYQEGDEIKYQIFNRETLTFMEGTVHVE